MSDEMLAAVCVELVKAIKALTAILEQLSRPIVDYTDPGPDPQPVDFDWLASIRKGMLAPRCPACEAGGKSCTVHSDARRNQ